MNSGHIYFTKVRKSERIKASCFFLALFNISNLHYRVYLGSLYLILYPSPLFDLKLLDFWSGTSIGWRRRRRVGPAHMLFSGCDFYTTVLPHCNGALRERTLHYYLDLFCFLFLFGSHSISHHS
jgi:hypothetical protein